MVVDDGQLHSFLLESGMLSRRDLAIAQEQAREKNQPLAQTLLSLSMLSADELRKAAGGSTGVPFIKLYPEDISFDVLSLIPEPFSRMHQVVAYKKERNMIEVAVLDLPTPHMLFVDPDSRVRIRLTDSQSMRGALMRYQKYLKRHVGDHIAREAQSLPVEDIHTEKDLSYAADRLATQHLLDLLLSHAVASRATDIHFDQLEKNMLVRYRIGGNLYEAMHLPRTAGTSVLARFKKLSQMPLISLSPQQGRFRIEKDNTGETLITLGSMPTVRGERMTLHLTPQGAGCSGFTLEALGFQGQALERMHTALSHPSGLILISGWEGQGKTTMLHTFLDLLSEPQKNIMHIGMHAPQHPGYVVHVQPTGEVGFSMSAALRSALKHDPDIIGIDRLDSEDSAAAALEAANQGVLVIATIEAPTAVDGMERLRRMTSSQRVSAVLRTSVGISHVRALCDQKNTYQPSSADVRLLEDIADPVRVMAALKENGVADSQALWKNLSLSRAVACESCDAGYRGRIGLQEVLPITEVLRTALRDDKEPEDLMHIARDEDMLTQLEDGVYKALQGYTTLDEVVRMAQGL